MNVHSGRASVAMLRMMGCANGRSARHLLHSDCVVDEKTVVLQKKENEGFGFVLRGAKGKSNILDFYPNSQTHASSHLPPFSKLFHVFMYVKFVREKMLQSC